MIWTRKIENTDDLPEGVVARLTISDRQLAIALSLQKRLADGEKVTREDFTSEDWT